MNVVIYTIIIHNSFNHGLTFLCIFAIQAQNKNHFRVYSLSVLQILNPPQKSKEDFQFKVMHLFLHQISHKEYADVKNKILM